MNLPAAQSSHDPILSTGATVPSRQSLGAALPPAHAVPRSSQRTRRSVHHDDRALERGTVAEAQNTQRPNLLIEGSGCGEFPDHVNRDAASCGSWRAQDYTQAPIPAPTPRPTWIPSPQPTPTASPPAEQPGALA